MPPRNDWKSTAWIVVIDDREDVDVFRETDQFFLSLLPSMNLL
jgi:hypothetical protein